MNTAQPDSSASPQRDAGAATSVTLEISNHVATVTLNRPQSMNAVAMIGKGVLVPGSAVKVGVDAANPSERVVTPYGIDLQKDAAKVQVRISDANGQVVRTIELGEQKAGVYTLDWRNPKSRFYKAMHISYPSPSDRERAQEKGVDPGGMVMIHGEHYEPAMRRVLRRNPKDWTEGCIALNNEHIDELWHTVPVGTPIEIKP